MTMLAELCAADELLHPTAHRVVDTTDGESELAGDGWWSQLTAAGGEGMVVKPLDFVAPGRRGLVQPALKMRGREYLRIVYGPEYTAPEQPRAAQGSRSRPQTLARRPRVRARHRGARALRPRRAPAPGPRVRLRRPRARERARRPPPVTRPAPEEIAEGGMIIRSLVGAGARRSDRDVAAPGGSRRPRRGRLPRPGVPRALGRPYDRRLI